MNKSESNQQATMMDNSEYEQQESTMDSDIPTVIYIPTIAIDAPTTFVLDDATAEDDRWQQETQGPVAPKKRRTSQMVDRWADERNQAGRPKRRASSGLKLPARRSSCGMLPHKH